MDDIKSMLTNEMLLAKVRIGVAANLTESVWLPAGMSRVMSLRGLSSLLSINCPLSLACQPGKLKVLSWMVEGEGEETESCLRWARLVTILICGSPAMTV